MQRMLVERAMDGDLDAYSELVRASHPRLFGIAHLILRDADRAEDAVQDALLLAWRHVRSLRDPEAWDAWLRRTDVDDTARAQLTSGPSWDSSPSWSPQGDRIAYWTQRTPAVPSVLMLMGADGSDLIELRALFEDGLQITDGLPPVWEPDGTRLAYSVNDASEYLIESIDPATREHHGVANGSYPSWSQDGAMIAYQGGPDRGEVWSVAADGTSPKRLATGWGPVWSPRGQIAYFAGQPGANDIWVIDADGTDATNITGSPGDEYWPSWSPDGSLLAFDRSTREFSNNEIVVAAPDGSGAVTLPGEPVTGGAPVWSPDGSMTPGRPIRGAGRGVRTRGLRRARFAVRSVHPRGRPHRLRQLAGAQVLTADRHRRRSEHEPRRGVAQR